jgi:hypothetical protein
LSVVTELAGCRRLEDLPRLAASLGCQPAWEEIPPSYWATRSPESWPCTRSALVGSLHGLPWYAVETATPIRTARTIVRRLFRRGEPAALFALDPASSSLALSVGFQEFPVLSLNPVLEPGVVRACLARVPEIRSGGKLATAARLSEILALEGLGTRFFIAFEQQLEAMTESLTGCRQGDRRALALLQLNRVLFLYFVESKGWLDGKPDFLRDQVDQCLAGKRSLDRHLLRPLFFGTLNRPAGGRTRGALRFGRIPFLNGGLFEPHALERKWTGTIPNSAWRNAFDNFFERFQFTAAEGTGCAIAPDMLGRVFEGVMVPDERRRSGTFYTPPRIVTSLLEECLVVFISREMGITSARAAELLHSPDEFPRGLVSRLTLLDPAAGSGAFLLVALERLSYLTRSPGESISAARRRVLINNLFGVDINSTAVRLTELRLWLSVIADDTTLNPDRVAPLPNLDGMVRQGDSLTDPLGLIAQMPFRPGAVGASLAGVRRAFSEATGREKSEAAKILRARELTAMRDCLDAAEKYLIADIAELVQAARSPDLFGEPAGATRAWERRLADLRQRLRPLRQARRRLEEQGEVGWFQYESHFADVFANRGGFDVVIGNPPWVRAEKLPTRVREHLQGRYCWWKGDGKSVAGYRHQPDLAVAFLERAHELARSGGVVGLLMPAKICSAGYATTARRAMTRDLSLHVIAELNSTSPAAFDATVYPMALVTSKERPCAGHQVRLTLGDPNGAWIRQSELTGGGPWMIRRAGAASIARELALRFDSIASRHAIHLGVKTGANAVFLNPPGEIETSLVRTAFRGRDLRPFVVVRTIPLLWPYTDEGQLLPRLPEKAHAHIRTHETRLAARADQHDGPPWMLFRTAGAVPGPRVVWADLSRRLTCVCLDGEDRRIPLNSCYVINTSAKAALALAAWLNSSWMRGLARLQADPASSGFARFNARTVGSLPLPRSVCTDAALAAFARQAVSGNYSQAELDELTAPHLDLSEDALRTFASMA